jgi:predicted nucleotidyltransferase
MVTRETIEEAARLLLAAAPGSKVILFGSHARGDAREDSDVDFLVVEPQVEDGCAEAVRLTDVLRPLLLPVEVLVVSAERFDYWRDTPNTVMYRAVREGKVYEQVA